MIRIDEFAAFVFVYVPTVVMILTWCGFKFIAKINKGKQDKDIE